MDNAQEALAVAGFDLAHAFDPRRVADLLPTLADAPQRRAILIGNTRALWPRFVAARAADPALAADPDPLDRYTERAVAAALPGAPAWFAHRAYNDAFVPFQRVAAATGLGVISPAHLLIHPIYGAWLALRAIALVPGEPPPPAPPPQLPCCTGDCAARLDQALASGALADWLALRDACQVGRAHRYSDEQIAYHYGRAFAGRVPTPSRSPARST